jgi:hypothetical protein
LYVATVAPYLGRMARWFVVVQGRVHRLRQARGRDSEKQRFREIRDSEIREAEIRAALRANVWSLPLCLSASLNL